MSPRLAFAPERELDELRSYLGDEFEQAKFDAWEQLLEDEAAAIADEGELYRTSRAYLYNLTAFAMSGLKLPYLRMLVEVIPPGARILDYGCGIGSDGLLLLEAGYRVEFADFDNPSTEYLRWRLAHRGLEAKVHDLDAEVPGGFDAAYSFDVIEHVPDAFDFLAQLESRSRLVEVNLLEYDRHEQTLHYRLPMRRLFQHIAQRGLKRYRVHYGSSHVVIYSPERVGPLRTARNLGLLAAGAARGVAAKAKGRVRGS